jgi:hypothetical protein
VMPRKVRRRGVGRHFDLRMTVCMILGCAVGWTWPTTSEAAKLDSYLTSEDLSGRIVFDQNGQKLTLPTAQDRHVTLPTGSTPTYLAIPLNGGEHLPSGLPIVDAGAQQGETTVGPLNFDALFKAKLDSTLDASRLAIVDTPSRNYLVEFLPAQVRSLAGKQKAGGGTSNPINELARVFNTSSNQWSKWTQSGMNELERLLNITNSKTLSFKPSLNLEAQLVGSPLAAPIPEPSTWLVFAELIGAAAALKLMVKTSRKGMGTAEKRIRPCRVSPTRASCEPSAGFTCPRGRHASFRPARADQCLEPRHRYGAGDAGNLGALETVRRTTFGRQ